MNVGTIFDPAIMNHERKMAMENDNNNNYNYNENNNKSTSDALLGCSGYLVEKGCGFLGFAIIGILLVMFL